MEDHQTRDITPNSPNLSQEDNVQDTKQLLNLSKWSELPPIVLEKIYSYLDRKDRSQMSLVCRKWCQEYSAPSLWRTMEVAFPQISHSGNVCQAVRYTEKYGYAFRHVEIQTKPVCRFNEVNLMKNQLKEFLEALTCFCQLYTISFLCITSPYYHTQQFEDILPKLIYFLLSQNKVESITFDTCAFHGLEALQILRAIFTKISGTLKHLALASFSHDVSAGDFRMYIIDMPLTYDILMNLRKIEIHYFEIECLITSCYEYGSTRELSNKMGKLEEITICCRDCDWSSCQRISLDAWKYFIEKCPSLEINLSYCARHENESTFEIGTCRLLSQLSCKINIYLEEVKIDSVKNPKPFHSDLINLLQACPILSKQTTFSGNSM